MTRTVPLHYPSLLFRNDFLGNSWIAWETDMKNTHLILKELFYVLTGALVVFIILELVWPDIVLAYINLNWILLIWLFVAIIILIMDNKR